MARETKAEKAARTARDNVIANEAAPFEYDDDLFGRVKIGENLGPVEDDGTGNGSQGWDIYDVEHSGVHHRWSSAVIAAVSRHTVQS